MKPIDPNNKHPYWRRQILIVLILLVADVVSISLGFQIAIEIRRLLIHWIKGALAPEIFSPLILEGLVIIISVYALTGMYPGFGRTSAEETQKLFYSCTLGFGILAFIIYLQQTGLILSRTVFLLGWGLGYLINLLLRFAIRNRASLYPWWGAPVLIVGPAAKTTEVVGKLINSRRLGLRPALVLDEAHRQGGEDQVMGIPVVDSLTKALAFRNDVNINHAVYIDSETNRQQMLRWLGEHFANVLLVLENSPFGSLYVKSMDLEGQLMLAIQYHLLDRKATFIKRAVDLLLGLVIGLVLLPFIILIALLIRLDSPGSAFLVQERLGRGGKVFSCFKFRSMKVDADSLLEVLLRTDSAACQEYGTFHKLKRDPRITRIGKILRKFSLDETPQIWNVIKGDMSLVGPRAYLPREKSDMGDYSALILRIRPGLTGWWQVMGRHETTFMKRLQLDEYYLGNWSLWMDLFIILKTAWVLLRGKGA
jgi:Undecaprenyl-phosphate galactose phosphotransferase WbaP